MEYITYKKAAERIGVTVSSISKWAKDTRLVEGPRAGKQKTVTQESLDKLLNDPLFMEGLASSSVKKKVIQSYETLSNDRTTEIESEILAQNREVADLKKEVEFLKRELLEIKLILQQTTKKKDIVSSVVTRQDPSKESEKVFADFNLNFFPHSKEWKAQKRIKGKQITVYIHKSKERPSDELIEKKIRAWHKKNGIKF